MKTHLLPSLAIAVALLAAASPGWAQSPEANKAQPASAQKSVKQAAAESKAARAEQDRREKAAKVNSSMQKKTDETAKSVIANTK
jgi:hypothetical protein